MSDINLLLGKGIRWEIGPPNLADTANPKFSTPVTRTTRHLILRYLRRSKARDDTSQGEETLEILLGIHGAHSSQRTVFIA